MTELRGLVATVLNERELVITIGSKDGVEEGMYFAVLSEDQLPIYYPGTDEVLDTIEREKVRVRVVDVRERISVCRTYKSYTTGLDLSGFGLTPGLFGPRETHYETLSSSKEDRPKPLNKGDSYVHVGDHVKEVFEDED